MIYTFFQTLWTITRAHDCVWHTETLQKIRLGASHQYFYFILLFFLAPHIPHDLACEPPSWTPMTRESPPRPSLGFCEEMRVFKNVPFLTRVFNNSNFLMFFIQRGLVVSFLFSPLVHVLMIWQPDFKAVACFLQRLENTKNIKSTVNGHVLAYTFGNEFSHVRMPSQIIGCLHWGYPNNLSVVFFYQFLFSFPPLHRFSGKSILGWKYFMRWRTWLFPHTFSYIIFGIFVPQISKGGICPLSPFHKWSWGKNGVNIFFGTMMYHVLFDFFICQETWWGKDSKLYFYLRFYVS